MGMFDSVWVPCPHCGEKVEFQSKAGDCCLRNYSAYTAPTHVLIDILNEPKFCRCGQWLALVDRRFPVEPPRPSPSVECVRTPNNPTVHGSQPQLRWWPDDEPFTWADLRDEPER